MPRGELTYNSCCGKLLVNGSTSTNYKFTYKYKFPSGENASNINFVGGVDVMNGGIPTASLNSNSTSKIVKSEEGIREIRK